MRAGGADAAAGTGSMPAAATAGADTASAAMGSVGGLELRHPRSQWMRGALQQLADFVALARAADISHLETHSAPDLAVAAKVPPPRRPPPRFPSSQLHVAEHCCPSQKLVRYSVAHDGAPRLCSCGVLFFYFCAVSTITCAT